MMLNLTPDAGVVIDSTSVSAWMMEPQHASLPRDGATAAKPTQCLAAAGG
jgi:hypothetical protein